MVVFISAYLAAVSLAGLTLGLVFILAKKDTGRRFQNFLFFVIVNDLVSLSDILFRFRPPSGEAWMGGGSARMAGFLTFPLMGAFSYLVVAALLELAGRPFPKALKKAYAAYWGLLFVGFLAAEFRSLTYKDDRLTHGLMPFFNIAIMVSGLGVSLYVLIRGGAGGDPAENRRVRRQGGYFLAAFLVFGALFFAPLGIAPDVLILARSLLGLAYLLPPLVGLNRGVKASGPAPLTRLGENAAGLDDWLERAGLSPRERQIALRVLEGKDNAAIGGEMFIGRRTVESHLYNIYRKLGVKNRLQLARRAAAETGPRE